MLSLGKLKQRSSEVPKVKQVANIQAQEHNTDPFQGPGWYRGPLITIMYETAHEMRQKGENSGRKYRREKKYRKGEHIERRKKWKEEKRKRILDFL